MKNSFKIPLKKLGQQTTELARNTVSTAEFVADFVADTLRAESRHFAFRAVDIVTAKLTGYRAPRRPDNSLEPLAGVGAANDPRSDLAPKTASVSEDLLSRF